MSAHDYDNHHCEGSLSDEDDDFDYTYATFTFGVPEEWRADFEHVRAGEYK